MAKQPIDSSGKAAANENNRPALMTLRGLVHQGKTLQQMADELDGAGFRTARSGEFQRTQVKRLLDRPTGQP